MSGCGVSDKKLSTAESRIAVLQQKGVPDSLLSEARVLLVQSRTSKQLGNSIGAKTQYDSLISLLSKADVSYGATTTQLKPVVVALRASLDIKKQSLTGLHLKAADSMLVFIDSSIKHNDWPTAKDLAQATDTFFTSLAQCQQIAVETKTKMIGTWSSVQALKSDGVKATKKDSYTFGKDGKVSISEEMNGQTSEFQKENWKFESQGTFDLKGDTIVIDITHEKCPKQEYENLKEANGKKTWVKIPKPTYDSTITSGKKIRIIAFDEIKSSMKKKK
jgi:hypothetical protein